jgi:hypothetical protein
MSTLSPLAKALGLTLGLTLAMACSTSYASNCDELRSQIEGKIKAAGVASFTVTVVDSGASAPGKVVGACDKGAKKIMYVQNAVPAAAGVPVAPASQAKAPTSAGATDSTSAKKSPAKNSGSNMLTECKDGTTSIGGSCK